MINIITAIKPEANPLIEKLGLKKDMSSKHFPLYGNDSYRLIISGTGKVKAAMACLHLYNYNKEFTFSSSHDLYINIGFCGTNSLERIPGDLILINKVIDMDTKKEYYPDIYFKYNIMEKPLNCSPVPVEYSSINKHEAYYDMESSGIMEFSEKYLETHQTLIIKIISDYLSPKKINISLLNNILVENIPSIEQISNQL